MWPDGWRWNRRRDQNSLEREGRLMALRAAISLAAMRLRNARQAAWKEKDQIIDEVINLLERARERSER
jgi:hypothetical protein